MKIEKARELIERYPTLSKKELGKLLYKENPMLFKDAEDGRMTVRRATGSVGKQSENYIKTDKYIGNLPQGEKNDFSPFILNGKRVGVICDLHIPYHDLDAIQIALTELKKQNIDTLVLNGDIIDCFMLSRWEKEPNKRSFAEEIQMLKVFLDDIKEYFEGVEIIYKLGNHEKRYEKFIQQKAPELFGLSVLDFDNLIDRKVKVLHDKKIIKAGKLNITHGHEFGESIFSPVNAARGLYLRAKTSTIAGHSHVTSEHIERDLSDNITGCWSIGSLCDLHPNYRPVNKWNHGFCLIEVFDSEGNFSVKNYKIINGNLV